MTGGRVVVLGKTGKNFAAGMSGGIAYVLDEDHTFYRRINKELVSLDVVSDKYDIEELRTMLQEHYEATNSTVAKKILENFEQYVPCFKKVTPVVYDRMLKSIAHFEGLGADHDQAMLDAFYANI